MFVPGQAPPPAALRQPWRLPPEGLAVFHGERHAPRLSHYFMPRLALEGKRILFLDGANCADPRLMARLAERRGMPFAQFNRQIMLARAFTCFQLTELIRRVPQFLAEFPAEVVMVTAFPELYFDEDIRQADATAAFQQALEALTIADWRLAIASRNSKLETRNSVEASRVSNFDFRASGELTGKQRPSIDPRPSTIGHPQPLPVTVALFSAASSFQPPAGRTRFFAQTCAAATELWKFQADEQGRLALIHQDKEPGNRELAAGSGERTKLETREAARGSDLFCRSAAFRLPVDAIENRQSAFDHGQSPAPNTHHLVLHEVRHGTNRCYIS